MGFDKIVLSKLFIVLAVSAINILIWIFKSRLRAIPFFRWVTICWMLKFICAMVLLAVFKVNYLRSDCSIFFQEFNSAYTGQIPFRDFFSCYNPLFQYGMGFFYRLGGIPGYMAALLGLEALAYILIDRLVSHIPIHPHRNAIFGLLFFSPLSISYILIEGQEDALVLLAILVPLLIYARSPFKASLLSGILYFFTKFLSILYIPVFLGLNGRKSWGYWLGVALIPAAYVGMLAAGLNPIQPLATQLQGQNSCSGNLLFLIDPLHDDSFVIKFFSFGLMALFGVLLLIRYWGGAYIKDNRNTLLISVALWQLFMLFSHKSLSAYNLSFFPILLAAVLFKYPGAAIELVLIQIPLAMHHTIFYRVRGSSWQEGFQYMFGILLVAIMLRELSWTRKLLSSSTPKSAHFIRG